MRIYTLTLSPAYDVHAGAETFAAFHENLATITSREAGGKGVNISRALTAGGGHSTPVVVLGKENAAEFQQALTDAGLEGLLFFRDGRIRENLTLHCPGVPETRISFTGFSVDEELLDQIREAMDVTQGTVVTFTGRVPSGIEMPRVKAFLKELQAAGARIVLDSRSFGLGDILEVRPWLIKPNQEEISMLCGCEVETMEQALEKAQVFVRAGIENVMVSLGGDGALLIHGGKVYRAIPPAITPVSTIGAGDSAIAGFIAAAQQGKAPQECLRWAAAYGTAACLTEGSQPPCGEEIRRILAQIQMQ